MFSSCIVSFTNDDVTTLDCKALMAARLSQFITDSFMFLLVKDCQAYSS